MRPSTSDSVETKNPTLVTARQLARPLQVSDRLIHMWAEKGTIPVALRAGKIVRFDPEAVASALGLPLDSLIASRHND